MKAVILDDQAVVYEEPDVEAKITRELAKGDEINLGQTIEKAGKMWGEISLPDGGARIY